MCRFIVNTETAIVNTFNLNSHRSEKLLICLNVNFHSRVNQILMVITSEEYSIIDCDKFTNKN